MTEYKKIAPLGDRPGHGTFETFFPYETLEEAEKENDYVVVNFVEDQDEDIHLEFYHVQSPDDKIYYRIDYQNFIPALGIDTRDDNMAQAIAFNFFSFKNTKE